MAKAQSSGGSGGSKLKQTSGGTRSADAATSFFDELARKDKRLKKLMARSDRKLAGQMDYRDNPWRKITIDASKNYETDDIVLDFVIQFVSGYVWACKHNYNFMAQHDELPALERLLDSAISYRKMRDDGKVNEDEIYGTRFAAWLLVQLAALQPGMWD